MSGNWTAFALAFVVALLAGVALRPAPAAPGTTHAPMKTEPVKKEPAPEPARARKGLLVDLGNAHCPVMDGETDGETFIEWNHMRVGFCCAGCDARFLADPETLLDKAAPEWREVKKAIDAYLGAAPEHKAHRLQEIRARWNVVREPEEG
jgi:hypothetical protein